LQDQGCDGASAVAEKITGHKAHTFAEHHPLAIQAYQVSHVVNLASTSVSEQLTIRRSILTTLEIIT